MSPSQTTKTPFPWNPGEHMAIVGQTGTGKSTLAKWILTKRTYSIVLLSKREDPKLAVEYVGLVTKKAGTLQDPRQAQLVLKPEYRQMEEVFREALKTAGKQGGWTVYIDELHVLCEKLKLSPEIDELLTQGRGNNLTVVTGMQRPSRVTRFALGESTHTLSFQLEGRDAMIFRDAAGTQAYKLVQQLGDHEFVWLRKPDRLAVCKLNVKRGELDIIPIEDRLREKDV